MIDVMELLIYSLDLDTEETPVSRLSVGEHVFGRGTLLKCDDKRVSRNHGILKVESLSATITSTHHNPCFYQSASSSTITILPKNNPVNIDDGDKFALLADQFWYRIKIKFEPRSVAPTLSNEMSDDSNTSIDFLQLNEKRKSDEEFGLIATKKVKHNESTVSDQDTDKEINNVRTVPLTNENGDSNTSIDFLTEERKNQDELDSPLSKKLSKNLSNESGNLLLEVDTNISLVDRRNVDSGNTNRATIKECLSESDDDLNVNNFCDNKKKELLSDSDGESTSKVPIKKTTQDKDRQAKLKAMLFSSDEEDTTDSIAQPEENKRGDPEVNLATALVSNDDESLENRQTPDPNAAGPSGTNGNRPWRDRCQYAGSCYRKNKLHFQEYSHPGDSDFESDPNDSRPLCVYGDSCYRLNKDHRRDYRHSKKNQPALNKKQTKTTNIPKKKRTATKQYKESSDDDYDLQDPFIDDSGSDFVVDSVSDDTTDSEISDGTQEETKRLVKEAKRFAKQ